MTGEPRPRRALPDEENDHEEVPRAAAMVTSPDTAVARRGTAVEALPFLVAFLVSAISQAVGGMLLEGDDRGVVICALTGAGAVLLSYFLPNGPLRGISKYRWTMVVAVGAALVVPASVVLLREEQGIWFTLTIATATGMSCAVLLVAAFRVRVSFAITSCSFLLLGVAGTLTAVAVLIDGSLLRGLTFLMLGVAGLFSGIAILIDDSSLQSGAFLLAGIAFLPVGVAVLMDRSPLRGAAFLVLGLAFLLLGVAVLIDGSLLRGIAFLLAGGGLLMAGVAFLIRGSSLPGVAFLLMGVGGLLAGVAVLINRAMLKNVKVLLTCVAFLVIGAGLMLLGVAFLVDSSSRWGGAAPLMGVAFLLCGVAFVLSSMFLTLSLFQMSADNQELDRSWVSYWLKGANKR